jgi:hypothetical protein
MKADALLVLLGHSPEKSEAEIAGQPCGPKLSPVAQDGILPGRACQRRPAECRGYQYTKFASVRMQLTGANGQSRPLPEFGDTGPSRNALAVRPVPPRKMDGAVHFFGMERLY